jgi:hypothetical protein
MASSIRRRQAIILAASLAIFPVPSLIVDQGGAQERTLSGDAALAKAIGALTPIPFTLAGF